MLPKSKVIKVRESRGLASYANKTRWTEALSELESFDLLARLKWLFDDELSKWSRWIIPVPGYLEVLSFGPIPFREIEWLEINPRVEKWRGALVEPEIVDHRSKVVYVLANSRLIYSEHDGVIRVWGYK